MAAPKGNRFWEARSSHGRNPKFASPDDLWSACIEYFEWVEANPLKEDKVFCFQGVITRTEISKMRAMTLTGLCLFLDISDETWRRFRLDEGFCGVTTRAEKIIYDQKFSGAAADLLNANIIARDLGLKDESKVDLKSSDGSMSPKQTKDLTDEELAEELARYGIELPNRRTAARKSNKARS